MCWSVCCTSRKVPVNISLNHLNHQYFEFSIYIEGGYLSLTSDLVPWWGGRMFERTEQ